MANNTVHLIGDIYWMPPHKPEKPRMPPNESFRALSFFTSDNSTGWTVTLNYSPISLEGQESFYKVRLNFAFLDDKRDKLKRLSKNTEIIIQDGFRVIAVCRNIQFPENEFSIDTKW